MALGIITFGWVVDKTPPAPARGKCYSCEKRRMCLVCICCQEKTCKECGHPAHANDDDKELRGRVCDACRDEGIEYARYGIWGPP